MGAESKLRLTTPVNGRKVNGEMKTNTVEQDLDRLFEYMDEKHGFFINRLRDFVEFRTVSSDPSKKEEFPKMAEFIVGILKKFGIQSMVMNMSETEENNERAGDTVPLILAETEIDPKKRTVLFYCHYDVYPINYHECWTDPFVLTMASNESELHGKGTSAAKGPLLCVINAIGAYQKKRIPLPVNVKLLLDPLGTADEDFTGKFLRKLDTDFFYNIDFVCLCTGRWLGNTRPCISHGSRGICYFTVEVEGPSKDLHSSYGGLINEPMADLIYVLNALVDKNGVIRITDIYEDVPPMAKEDKKFFESVHFSVRVLQQEIGAAELQVNEDKAAILMRLWCQPSLTIHGIQGAFSVPGTKNVIPGKVTGKFSINLVPNMSLSKVKKKVVDYLAKVWKTRKSPNKIRVQMTIGKLFWYTDPNDINVVAAKNAVAKVYNADPDLIREPNRVRIANVLRKLTAAPVVMIPIGRSNDVSDLDSEKLDVTNYINGSKIFAAYMMYLAELFPRVTTPQDKCSCQITGQLDSCKCYLEYISPPEEEGQSWDWSVSPGMSVDEKPELKYYYLSLLALKRMQKLQEVISSSHLGQISSGALKNQDGGESEVRTSIEMKESRAALQSFSVADLHDESKPRIGGWLAKSNSTKHTLPIGSSMLADSAMRPLESNTRIIPQEQFHPSKQPTALQPTALQPTVFSFRMAQSLKKVRPGPFDAAKYKVLRDIRSVQPELAAKAVKDKSSSVANLAVAKPADGPEMSGSKSAPNLVVECRQNSSAEASLSSMSEVSHPNVEHSVNPFEVMSSTSRIWYDRRLLKESAESAQSLKSVSPSFRVLSSAKVNESLATASLASLARPEASPGNPINSNAVVSSLSKMLYDRRMTKELTASMQVVKSGVNNNIMMNLASPATTESVSSSAANPIATNSPRVEPGDSVMTQK